MWSSVEKVEECILQLLECPVCLEYCQAPIFTCVNGHHLCTDCKKALKSCPVCRARGSPAVRNIALDALSEQVLLVPCKFKCNGCGVKRKREEDLEDHYRNCKYQVAYKCLAQTACGFVGGRLEVHDHVLKEHPENVLLLKATITLMFNTTEDTRYRAIMKYKKEGECFWICIRHIATKIIFYARYIGSDENSARFKIHWQIGSGGKTAKFAKTPLKMEEDELASGNTIALADSYFDLAPGLNRNVDVSVKAVKMV